MSKNDFSAENLQGITRDELWEIERSGRSRKQNTHDIIISVLPAAGFAAAVMEYLLIPNKYNNQYPERYLIFLAIPIFVYAIRWILSFRLYMRGNRKRFAHRHREGRFYHCRKDNEKKDEDRCGHRKGRDLHKRIFSKEERRGRHSADEDDACEPEPGVAFHRSLKPLDDGDCASAECKENVAGCCEEGGFDERVRRYVKKER